MDCTVGAAVLAGLDVEDAALEASEGERGMVDSAARAGWALRGKTRVSGSRVDRRVNACSAYSEKGLVS
jgi:hypothetical protein